MFVNLPLRLTTNYRSQKQSTHSLSCFKRVGDAELEFFHAWKGELPTIENTRHLDALVSLGSAHMVRENLDWMADLSNFFLALETSHIKVNLLENELNEQCICDDEHCT